ncbi:MAG: hypothetical protein AAF740_01635 [Bacteroidota bacterium]
MDINIADLVSEFGDFYLGKSNEANMSRLKQVAYARSFTNKYVFSRKLTDATIYRAAESRFRSVLQQFQIAFTPRPGELKFVPITIFLRHMKVDEEISPYELMGSWVDFLATAGPNGSELDPKAFPFIAWFLEMHLFPQLQQDWELEAVYKGQYVAPTPGVAGNPAEVIDGIEKIIDDAVIAGRIAPFVMGATPTGVGANEQMVEYVYDYCDRYDDIVTHRNKKGATLVCGSKRNARKLQMGLDKVHNSNYDKVQVPDDIQTMEGEPIIIKIPLKGNKFFVGLDSMEGKDRLWSSPKINNVYLEKRGINFERMHLESDKRFVNGMTDFYRGIGFDIPELVGSTDQR